MRNNLICPFYDYSITPLKMVLLFLFLYCLFPGAALSQTPVIPGITEQQLEGIAENNEDAEIEDDAYLQQMQQYIKDPVNLNYAGGDELKELRLLNPLQIQNLIAYRNLFGKLIDVYELQAIPGWDIGLIQKIRPYISINREVELLNSIGKRLKGGEHSIILRVGQVLERSKGYLMDSSTAINFYPGSPQKLLLRYKYQYKNLLQYGIIGEKDAGEQFFKGKQKQGFDFYSAHFFARNIGVIKSIAIGDFTVNLGQGLTQWQSLAFKKSVDAMNIKREAAVLRPYNSAGEINFHRGAGITIAKKKWEATAFISCKRIDANFVPDSAQNGEDFVSSLQTSGYHRSISETADKGIQTQLAFGANLSMQFKKVHIGLNGIQYQFRLPLNKTGEPYNLYALSGKSFGNYSIDYSYTYQNLHFFGEAATTADRYTAFLNGILISAAQDIDLSFVYRNISPGYQSLYTSAFTENTYPTNEKGFYSGIAIHPGSKWTIAAYADFYKFPWLKFRVNAPAYGCGYLVQVTFKPAKQLEIYTRLKSEAAGINFNPDQFILSPVIRQPKQTWRTQFNCRLNQQVEMNSRAELLWFSAGTPQQEQGFLIWLNLSYRSISKPLSISARWQYFETDSYNSRIYGYENDVLYNVSIPAFYDKGVRYYINANYHINKKLGFGIKWAQSLYKNKTLIGSGLDEIKGSAKSEIRLQAVYTF